MKTFSTSTPNFRIYPEHICVLPVPINIIVGYQKQMSRAVWRPAPGRKLGGAVFPSNRQRRRHIAQVHGLVAA